MVVVVDLFVDSVVSRKIIIFCCCSLLLAGDIEAPVVEDKI